VRGVEAGAVQREVGDTRWVGDPEGHLDGLAFARLALGGGRFLEPREARYLADMAQSGNSEERGKVDPATMEGAAMDLDYRAPRLV
jgi:hypothetical protein